jgi:NAD(P)-dependent dehydrogenase (short-subunit alcohol dehydrogenase family)
MAYLNEMFGLEGKTAVVTGGGGVLCSQMGSALAQAGARVILWDIRPEALEDKVKAVAAECGDPKRVFSVTVDLMNEASIAEALQKSVKRRGRQPR